MADDFKTIPVSSAQGADASAVAVPALDGEDFSDVEAELKQRFELLPEDIRQAIMDTGYQQKLFDIAKERKLTYEELGILETETTMVLLGMTKPADYRDGLQVELKKNDADLDPIVAAVNEKVFAPVRASLERLYSAKREPGDYAGKDVLAAAIAGADASATPAPQSAPAYAPTAAVNPIPAAPAQVLTPGEQSVLAKTGVILSDAPKPAAPSPVVGSIASRDDLLKSIENPPRVPSASLVADKLKPAGPVIPAVKTTDYSMPARQEGASGAAIHGSAVPAATPAAASAPKTDPYREPV